MFSRLGFNTDEAVSDWGTVVQRRVIKEPLDKGGWSVFCTTFSWSEYADPAVNVALRGNGQAAYFGWPTAPRLEDLRESWFDAADDASRKAITDQMQVTAMPELPFIPLGAFFVTTAYSKSLSDRIVALPPFWNIKRS